MPGDTGGEQGERHNARQDVTALLARAGRGEKAALDELLPILYDTLRGIARGQLRGERRGHTLGTTALVHEAYLKLVVIPAVAALLLVSGCGPEPVQAPGSSGESAGTPGEPPRQVILLLLDAARPDHFSCYGYPRETTPAIDALAAGGVVFRNHYAQGTGTRESIPSLLYSRYYSVPLFPGDAEVPYAAPAMLFRRPDDQQVSFVEAFEGEGFATAAISAHLWTGEETPFAAEFQEMIDLTQGHRSAKHPYPEAAVVMATASAWIRRHRAEDFFLYVHLMDTHYPHYLDADAQAFFGAESYRRRNPGAQGFTAEDRRYVEALYDGSLRSADREIGHTIELLRAEGLLESAVVAVTSDHGEHLFDGAGGQPRPGVSPFTHGGPWLEPLARIPFVLHAPGRLEPGTFEGLSEGVDVGPTLLALAGVSTPPGKSFDGIDLAAVLAGRRPGKERALMRAALRTDRYKVLFETDDGRLLAEDAPDAKELEGSLYDLEADPAEAADLFADRPVVVGELLGLYRRELKTPYERALNARTRRQPTAAFAISAAHWATEPPVADAVGAAMPSGWSRVVAEPHSALVAQATDEPLEIRFRIPDGSYHLSVGLVGRAEIGVGEQRRPLSGRGAGVEFGEVVIEGERFVATLHPRADQPLRVFFFGFTPPGAAADPDEAEETRRRLKALGYVQ